MTGADDVELRAFALLVARGFFTLPQAVRALLTRQHFQPLTPEQRANKHVAWPTVRGMAWLLAAGEVTYSHAEIVIIQAIAGREYEDLEEAERVAPNLLREAADALDDARAAVGRELRAAIADLTVREAAFA